MKDTLEKVHEIIWITFKAVYIVYRFFWYFQAQKEIRQSVENLRLR